MRNFSENEIKDLYNKGEGVAQEGWEKEIDDKFIDFPTIGGITREMLADDIKQTFRILLTKAREEEFEKYDDIFSWLLGEHGDFPDLSIAEAPLLFQKGTT